MWEVFLNSVLSGWLKLLIIVLARSWTVLLTKYKWVVVNSIRNKKWVIHFYKSQMGYKFSATHLRAYEVDASPKKRSWRICKALSTYYSQHTVLAAVAVECPSNGCRASSSISDILVSVAQKMIPPPDIWGAPFRKLTCGGPTKLTGTEGFVNLVNMNDSSCRDRTMSIQRR